MFLGTSWTLSLVLAFLPHSLTAFGAPINDTKLITPEIDEYIRSVHQQWNMTGLALAIVREDPGSPTGWYQEFVSYGMAKEDRTPVTSDTTFAIASNSKLFTALAVGLLFSNESLKAEFGKELTWSTKARNVFGEVWGLMDDVATRDASIQDMLSHRTGLPRHDGCDGRTKGGLAGKTSKLRYLRPSAELREVFQYNNLMYDSLGYIPEVLVKRSLGSYVAEHLFAPLNMTSSTYSIAEAEQGPMAHGFQISDQDLKRGLEGIKKAVVPFFQRPGDENINAGSGGVFSSAKDMATWVSMLLAVGKHPQNNQTIIPEDVVIHTAKGVSMPSGTSRFAEMSPMMYGAGQYKYAYRGHGVIEHEGNHVGFSSSVSLFPNDNLGIVLLNNDWTMNSALEAIKWRIVDEHVVKATVANSPIIDWSSRYLALEKEFAEANRAFTPRSPDAELPPLPLSNLEQRSFSHPTYGTIHPCLVPASTRSASGSGSNCPILLESPPVQRILNMTDLSAPTFIIQFEGAWSTHIRLSHFDTNVFNATVFFANAETRLKEGLGSIDEGGRWTDSGDVVLPMLDFLLEWVTDGDEEGLAFRGDAWGMGPDAREPLGSGKAGAEVWFTRVTRRI